MDDLETRLTERGARWREAQPPPPVPHLAALTERRTPPRWVVPLVAAASVIVVAVGGALVLDRDGDPGPAPVETPRPDPDAVVPFLPIDPREPTYAPPTRVLVPDPVVDSRTPDCKASDLQARSDETAVGSGFVFMTLTVTISRPGGDTCVLRGQPEVSLLDRGRPITVELDHLVPVSAWWAGDVVVGDGLRAQLTLNWTAPSCPSPGRHDKIALAWPGAGQLTAPGFEPFPDNCTESEVLGESTVGVGVVTPEHWRWEDRYPLGRDQFFVRQYDAELSEPGEAATFFVALGGNGREVDLSPCPDFEIEATYSVDDVATERFGLNCDAIPYRRADGTPYLPKNQAVRFAFDSVLADSNFEKLTWRLLTPEPLELRLDLPVRVPADAPVQPMAEEDANLHLAVTSQAVNDDPVHVKVWVDEVLVVDQAFDAGSGHTHIRFPLKVAPGTHDVRMEAPGARGEQSISVPADADRFALVSYWNDDVGRRFVWHVQDKRFMIA